ncbi:transketolase [Mesorhizobium sp. M7A.F.Ca.US.011.01.1.1]|uniref:transketolase n=1 Tax=unclassified Mesorhizobium TaxID=325217 RepID=UPI000FCC2F9F|nr:MULTISPECIES: transketolase [unclassified Mesorhizobium]RUW89665.1 transketolase [Mesorhizobium sp. M7A.F.Ca.US.010.02.1.1]RUX22165.1 transketolase [Mesorhizobium sp. M7A.F.Ca.US.011.01.1.1]
MLLAQKDFARPDLLANAIRALSMDAVENAKSGHPGMPMGMAEIAVALWHRHLRHNPSNPAWTDRDRVVLSNGHGSMLLYSVLHLTGYDVSIDDLRQFRQLDSRTPGHPEFGYTPGVEVTTGPLGQGLANAVGMAIAEKTLAAACNRPGHDIVDHHTFVLAGDGCLMEGISHEACSLAGTLGLGKLIVLYDDNGISIDGHVEGWFSDDTPKRFEAYGWQVIADVDGHDVEAVDRAISAAKAQAARPTLICCKTMIGKGAPTKAGSHDSHGSPLGADEVGRARLALDWPHAPFDVPGEIGDAWNASVRGAASEADWRRRFEAYRAAYPDDAAEFERRATHHLPAGFAAKADAFVAQTVEKAETLATRKASQNAIQAFSNFLPELIGGSADLASSNLTLWTGAEPITSVSGGNYIYYGVREFGMAAIMNGLMAHGGFRPFGGTFLMFSEYARNALRMAALMKLGAIYVFTHDSIALGQDGPTHQPIEQLATLRLMPNMDVWRPCDTVETAVAWQIALEQVATPTSLALSRQNLPFQPRDNAQVQAVRRGGYVLRGEDRRLDAVIIATGSEVQLAVGAQERLAKQGIPVRVVSMPSTSAFDRQDDGYKAEVLPRGVPRISVEAGVTDYWRKYVGLEGECVGIDTFGESAPAEMLYEHFHLTVEAVEKAVYRALEKHRRAASPELGGQQAR